jgi:hypothetical protein
VVLETESDKLDHCWELLVTVSNSRDWIILDHIYLCFVLWNSGAE